MFRERYIFLALSFPCLSFYDFKWFVDKNSYYSPFEKLPFVVWFFDNWLFKFIMIELLKIQENCICHENVGKNFQGKGIESFLLYLSWLQSTLLFMFSLWITLDLSFMLAVGPFASGDSVFKRVGEGKNILKSSTLAVEIIKF